MAALPEYVNPAPNEVDIGPPAAHDLCAAEAYALHQKDWRPLVSDRSPPHPLQLFTVDVEQWVSHDRRERRRKDPKTPVSDQALMRMVRRVCKRAAVRSLSPHQLRHGFANRFLRESGRDVVALQALMGHRHPDTTQQYTDELRLDELADTQASHSLTTVDVQLSDELETLRWRRRESNPRSVPAVLRPIAGELEDGLLADADCHQISIPVEGPAIVINRHGVVRHIRRGEYG